ncbi:MAG: M14 family zinc carboxypeptidase [Planctomycetota bacterium]
MPPKAWLLVLLAVSILESSCLASQGAVTTPEQHLGRPLASDFVLPDWREVKSYFETLDQQSENVVTSTVGKSTEGRDFVLCTISSAANLRDLERLRGIARRLADPRGASQAEREEAVKSGKVFLFVSCAMHATECASPQFAMQLAHDLATSSEEPWRSARENLVVLLAPSLNPDGLDHVVEWYRKVVGTPYEASELPKLYQLYAGHDNNRDWFTLTQKETRLVTRLLYEEWHPQVYWDVHQQGSSAERMFVPPFRDPLSPNLDPAIIGAINLLGTRAQLDLTRDGKTGVASGGTYDMWWNGGNRNVPVRHNIIGLLTEVASCRLASPIFQEVTSLRAPDGTPGYMPSNRFIAPWPGGWWRIRDIVDYEMAFARSLCASLSRERALYLRNALEAADRSLAAGRDDAPIAWILPAEQRDPGATERLADVLLATGVELEVAGEAVIADGRTYPAGSIVIRREQPYGNHVKDLFDVQRYPDGDAPYDVAGWTLPFLFGVRRVEVIEKLEARTQRARTIEAATAGLQRENGLLARDSNGWKQVFARLSKGDALVFHPRGEKAGRFEPRTDAEASEGEIAIARLPRIGLYAPWTGSMDEGWARWVLDTYGVAYTSVRNEMLRAGELEAFLDVLVIPSLDARELDRGRADGSAPPELVGGLDPEGAVAVEEFVRAGGRLVAIGSSSKWAVDLLRLPLTDGMSEAEAKTFSCPGSVLRAVPDASHSLTADLGESVPVFFSRGLAWREMNEKEREAVGLSKHEKEVEVLLRYAPTRLLLSGWIKTPEAIAGKAAWVRVQHGKGAVHLFGFRPQYRGWSQAAFQLLFRAMLLDTRGVK